MSDQIKTKYIIPAGSVQCNLPVLFTEFLQHKDSPFVDQYHFFAERDFLKRNGAFEEGLEMTFPYYTRLKEYESHEMCLLQELEKQTPKRARRKVVIDLDQIEIFPDRNSQFLSMGTLTTSEVDSVQLHTKQATRLWYGMPRTTTNKFGYPGVMAAISAMYKIVSTSRNDNPFADHALIEIEQKISSAVETLVVEEQKVTTTLAALEKRGIKLNLLSSDEPLSIPLEFSHPYGYLLIQALVQYDYVVRQILTLGMKSIITKKTESDAIHFCTKQFRSLNAYISTKEKTVSILKDVTRSVLIDGQDKAKNMAKLISNTPSIIKIPLNVLVFKDSPEYLILKNSYSPEHLKKLEAFAIEYEIALENV